MRYVNERAELAGGDLTLILSFTFLAAAVTEAIGVHAAFGAGLPAGSSERSTFGSFDDHAGMIRLFGREVIPAFAGR